MLTRRRFLRTAVAAAAMPLVGCGHHLARKKFPGKRSDFHDVGDLPLPTLQIGPSTGRGVIVLHEIPGLTKDDLALARALGQRGFNVFAPLMFGTPEQDTVLGGYLQACRKDRFECSALSARSPILDKLAGVCDGVYARTGHDVSVIGMCLTGVLPLALLDHHVDAAILCQPTVPFDALRGIPVGEQVHNLGLGADDLDAARRSPVPFLLIHYDGDRRCPPERVKAIRDTFANRVAVIALPGKHHSSLAGDFDDTAFDDAVDYLGVRLGVESGARDMRIARWGPEPGPCRIGVDRTWHAR
jgi:dienelactone hydrolase